MTRLAKMLIPLAVGAGCLVVLIIALDQRRNHAIMANPTSSEDLEREIRRGLPLGSSLSGVEHFLAERRLEFSYDEPSKSVYAVAKNLKGSTATASKALQLQFHFDDALKLRSIEAKVIYTGP